MAPEQARGEKVDPHCDLFSLGVVLYRMCTGQMPFRGETTTALLLALITEEPVPVREVNPEVPPELAELVMQLLAKDPARRPASAQAVADRLQTIGQGVARAAVQAKPAAPPAAPAPRRSSSRRLVLAAVALMVVLGGGFAAYQLLFKTKDGTLVVEVDGGADVRFQKGELRIYDSDGKLKYTLKPSDKNRTLPPGKHLIEVAGVDGLKVDTEKFEITRGDRTTVRVTVDAAALVKNHPPTGAAEWVPLFNGKDLSGWLVDDDPKAFAVDGTKQELVARAAGRSVDHDR
jgi:hypothetical protein